MHTPGADHANVLEYTINSIYKDTKIVYSNALPSTQPDSLINKFYNLFDVLVNRSSMEGFGLPIAEAMAAGTPCISVNTVGPSALIGPDTGWLLEAECTPLVGNIVTPYIQSRFVSDKRFEAALDTAYNNKKERELKGSKGREFIKTNYNSKDMVKGIEEQLQHAIDNWTAYPVFTLTSLPLLNKSQISEEVNNG